MLRINEQKAKKKWNSVLENMGVSESKRGWMAEYAEYHSINENAYVNATTAGMGSVTSPQPANLAGQLGGGAGFGGQNQPQGLGIGSGDLGQNLLPVAMKIAAQTIGLDLVAVKPTPGPKIDLLYVDFRYDDLRDIENDARPQVFKLESTGTSSTSIDTLVSEIRSDISSNGLRETQGGLEDGQLFYNIKGSTVSVSEPSDKSNQVEFLGFSRIDGKPMFRAYRQANSTMPGRNHGYPYSFKATLNTFPETGSMAEAITAIKGVTMSNPSIELVSALEDQLPGFSTNWTANENSGDYPMDRDTDDKRYAGQIGPNIKSKSVKVGTAEVKTALRRTEIEDIKANTGMDIVQKMESVLVNELSQTISRQIVSRVHELGDTNRSTAPLSGTASFSETEPSTVFDLDTAYAAGQGPGGETTHAIQRKLITKIVNASNYILTEGRVGPAQYAVTSGAIAASFMDISGYTINPVQSNLNGEGQLFPVGKIGNIEIYVDPYQRYDDNRIVLGRKNNPDQPGLIFVPYLMAQSISLMSEATFAPTMLLRSRYAITDVGFFPEKQFMTILVKDANQFLN